VTNQLHFKFESYKIGDLVKKAACIPDSYKKVGVIVEVGEELIDENRQWLKVHWLNYGSFWTNSCTLCKISGNSEIKNQKRRFGGVFGHSNPQSQEE
jgi:hypothetical protein